MGVVRRSGVAAAIGLGILGGTSLIPSSAHAEFIATIVQDGPNVVVTGAGSVDLSGLTFLDNATGMSGIEPSGAVLGIGSPTDEEEDIYTGFSGPGNFGTGGLVAPSDSGSGDKVVLETPVNELGVPIGYISGAALSDTSTFDNSTFASLGLTPGTYSYTWSGDSFVVEIGTAVPEPSDLSLLAVALGMTLVAARGRRRT